jgi:hypothetical protein
MDTTNAEFDADLEKIKTVHAKKTINERKGKIEFLTFTVLLRVKAFSAYNSFWVNFFAIFSADSKSASNSVIFHTDIELWKHLALFSPKHFLPILI